MVDETVTGDDREAQEAGLLSRRHTRRQLLQYGAAATAIVAVPGMLDACGGGSKSSTTKSAVFNSSYKPVALTSQEMTTLEAALSQLFPNDELGPGAIEAGVPVYIDRSLAGSYKPLLPVYRGLLASFDTAAGSAHAKSFATLPAGHQISLLEQFEAGKAPGVSAAEQAAGASGLQLLLEHMREGMFGDPMYGGNKDLAGWKLIGYPGVTLVWSAQDQTIGTKVPPSGKTAESYGGAPYNGPPA